MFGRPYTGILRHIVLNAHYVAGSFGSPVVTADHLLLSAMKIEPGYFMALMRAQPKMMVASLCKKMGSNSSIAPSWKLADDILRVANKEAESFGHPKIGTEHMLLGIFKVCASSCAVRTLEENGLSLEGIEFAVSEGKMATMREEAKLPVFEPRFPISALAAIR